MEDKKKAPSKYKARIGKASSFHPIDLSMGFFFFLFAFHFLLHRGVQKMWKLFRQFKEATKDDNFMHHIESIEVIVSKVLSVAMVLVILVAIFDLGVLLIKELFTTAYGEINRTLFKIFGLFLNILIALEILENITAYLRKHVVQVELVIVTSLIAVSRKIIILDLEKTDGIEVIGLAIAIFALSISYWIIRYSNSKSKT